MKIRNTVYLLISIVIGTLCFEATYAGGAAENVTIQRLHLRRSVGDIVFIKLSAEPTGKPGCSASQSWHFTLPLNSDLNKHIYASLLAAYARGSVIRVDGTGLCSDYNAIESLDGVVLYD